MTTERWLPVPGFEGDYSVSDHGRVRSEPGVVIRANGRRCTRPGKILKPYPGDRGHLRAVLMRRGQRHSLAVHRLVLSAFVGPCPPGLQGLHWDDVPTNNHVSNLRWGTQSDNTRDMVRNGNHHLAKKTRCKWGHKFTPENTAIRKNGRECRACKPLRRERNRRAAAAS